MGDVVYVGESGGYKHVVLILARETGIGFEDDLLGGELFAVFFGDFNLFHLGLLAWLALTFSFHRGLLGRDC